MHLRKCYPLPFNHSPYIIISQIFFMVKF
jgi:hypothetical protein